MLPTYVKFSVLLSCLCVLHVTSDLSPWLLFPAKSQGIFQISLLLLQSFATLLLQSEALGCCPCQLLVLRWYVCMSFQSKASSKWVRWHPSIHFRCWGGKLTCKTRISFKSKWVKLGTSGCRWFNILLVIKWIRYIERILVTVISKRVFCEFQTSIEMLWMLCCCFGGSWSPCGCWHCLAWNFICCFRKLKKGEEEQNCF